MHIPRVWTVLAKLTFDVYLLHMPVVYVFNHVDIFQRATSAVALLAALPFALAASFAIALLFYLCVESPLGRISDIVMKRLGI